MSRWAASIRNAEVQSGDSLAVFFANYALA